MNEITLVELSKIIDRNKISKRAWAHLGTLCNAKCSFCYYKEDLTKINDVHDLKIKIIELKELGYEIIELSGGETTIYPHLFELIDFIESLDLKFSFTTNGSKLSTIEKIIENHKNSLNLITFSLHSLNYNDVILNLDVSKKLFKAIEMCEKENIPFRINTVITNEEKYIEKDLLEYVNDSKAIQHNFLWICNWGDTQNDYDIDYIRRTIKFIEDNSTKYVLRYVPKCYTTKYKTAGYIEQYQDKWDWNINAYYRNKWNNVVAFHKNLVHRRKKDFKKSEECMDCKFFLICDGVQTTKENPTVFPVSKD